MNWIRQQLQRMAAKHLFNNQVVGLVYEAPGKGRAVHRGWLYGHGWHINFNVAPACCVKMQKIDE